MRSVPRAFPALRPIISVDCCADLTGKPREKERVRVSGPDEEIVAKNPALMLNWSLTGQTIKDSDMSTVIAASEAKAKFSELLDRVASGESFSITLHGQETAKLVPAKHPSLEDIQETIAQLKASRSMLNLPGQAKIKIKDLVNEGRP